MNKTILLFFLMFSCFAVAQDVNMQNGTFPRCSGVFYDSGGATGDYGNNENFEMTICPDIPGQKLQLNFTAFNTQSGLDIMTVFDGNSNLSPTIGFFSGPIIPGAIRASATNTSGCLTIQFSTNATIPSTGWVANMQCFEPCQTIAAQLVSSTPAQNVDGIIRVCPNENITLEGSGVFSDDGTGATYEWDLGDGRIIPGQSANFSYPDPGVYIANLNIRDTNTTVYPLGCPNTVQINQVIQVSTDPDFNGTAAADSTICFGDSTTIEGKVTPIEFIKDCTPPVSDVTFLPDGTGVSYETILNVECYSASQTLTDINQLESICLNIEHSFLGDLTLEIISPNGQSVILHNLTTAQSAASANLGTPWAAGALDSQSNNTTPGIGGDYCFVPGNANPTLEGGVQTGGVFVYGDGPTTYPDSFIPEGNYRSLNPLTALVGSPLNGIWRIRITDNFQEDNGYIFSWKLNFDPSILPANLSFTPTFASESWDTDPSITNINGNTITVQPATSGTHCYTYRALDDFGCEYTEQVCINVLPEIITATPIDLLVCDTGPPYLYNLTQNTPVVIANSTIPSDLVVTYHLTLAGANSDDTSINSPTTYSGTDGQTIYARIEYLNSGCYEVETFLLGLTDPPIINPVLDLITCDDNSNDGREVFDLESQTLTILGTQPASDFNVKYYTSLANAESGTNALSSPFTNTVNPQPIYVRVERANETSCYSTSGTPLFNLIVDYRAVANQPSSYEICDDLTNDGIEQFDLTSQDPTILGGQDPTLFTVSYYENQTDADSGMNPIINPTTFINNPLQPTIFVRVEENANPICYSLTSFELVVNPMPSVVMPTSLDNCDDGTPDGITEFDLTLKNNEITAGDPNLTVSYYETNAEAQAQNNVITNPTTYVNRSVNGLPANPQTLYVVVTNTNTNCVNYTTLTLNVLPNPIPNTNPNDLTQCDDNNPGDLQEVFDLTVNEAYIINGQLGVTATYYDDPNDAESGSNSIPNTTTYPNSSPTQTIYVRVTNDATGCFTIVNFDIIVNPVPQVIPITDLIVCEDNTTGVYAFDLESKTAEILNGQDPSLFSVTYHESQADADNLMSPLSSPYLNTASNPQQIFVANTNTVTGCSISTPSFYIEVQEIPEANSDSQPIIYTLCDNIGNNDGFGQFDLTTQDANVLDGQNPSNFTVTYFSSLANANARINPIPTIYENSSNPQVIYARVDDDSSPDSICYAITDLTLTVELLPAYDLEESYILCVNSNGTEVSGPPVLETGLSASNYTFEWSLDGTVIVGETNSSLIPNQGGTYSVTVTDNSTLCQKIDSAEVIESAPPVVIANVTTNAFVDNDIVVANATGFGEYEYRLDFGPWQDSGTFENVSGGEHIVTARDKIGCGLSSITVMVIDYPLYFTPNGDSFNDTWNVKGLENQNNVAVYIYDRFGKLLKQISASGDGWNGTFNGALMPSSDYWFTVIYNEVGSNERKEFSSHFSLKR